MATVNFSVPDEVKEAFNQAFEGENKSAMRRASPTIHQKVVYTPTPPPRTRAKRHDTGDRFINIAVPFRRDPVHKRRSVLRRVGQIRPTYFTLN